MDVNSFHKKKKKKLFKKNCSADQQSANDFQTPHLAKTSIIPPTVPHTSKKTEKKEKKHKSAKRLDRNTDGRVKLA